MTTEDIHVGRGGRGVAEQVNLLRAMETAGKLTFLRMNRPDTATGQPRQYVVDHGKGETVIDAADIVKWAAGFEAGWAVPKAPPSLAANLEEMEQADLRNLSKVVTAELKRRKA